ncbi:protease inhibitor I42 family protein [Ensifer sp. ENS04]|uniref:protease inhibitor I42 family protein n=1 Tax=Ensifer sp. ENS04 TaxID=2769281 RepID=UPI001781168C|nr:protease inhibitor I42 family protein [Ensifer sp. ENS04]MBD9541739.1 protease inhibitor I42 family protein [Ensifer sp. ENS04]
MQIVDLGQQLSVSIDEPFAVDVKNGGLSGASWTVVLPDGVALIKKTTTPAGQMGGGPKRQYVFRCQRSGDFNLKFELKRPWEPQGKTKEMVIHCLP